MVAVAALTAPGLASAADPKAETQGPADLTATSATFKANVVLSALGIVTWDYGTTTSYGMTTPGVQTTLLNTSQNVTTPVTGLLPETTYHVRVTATALLVTLQGKDVTFKTKPAPKTTTTTTSPGTSTTTTTPATTTTTASTTSATTPTTTTSSSGRSGGSDDSSSSTTSKGSGLDDARLADDGTDGGATTPPGLATASVAPDFGRSVAAAAVAGSVRATAPDGATVNLADAKTIPTGTLIDARHGTVELKTALDASGDTQTARFWGAQFEVRQSASRKGLTQLVLRGANFSSCPAARSTKARAASTKATKKKHPARSLWGSDDHGRFETRGRGSVATVRGTRWVTTDTCAGTRTTVLKGAVAVKDLARHKTVLVTKGHSYLARVAR